VAAHAARCRQRTATQSRKIFARRDDRR